MSFRSAYDVYSGQPYLATDERFIIQDLGIHILDVARFLFGDVGRLTATVQRVNQAIRGEDVATFLLGHLSGATSIVDCSYSTVLEEELFPQTLIDVDGTAGTIRLGANYRLTVSSRAGTRDVSPLDAGPLAQHRRERSQHPSPLGRLHAPGDHARNVGGGQFEDPGAG